MSKTLTTKSGARHSATDQSHLDTALNHLVQAGAALPRNTEIGSSEEADDGTTGQEWHASDWVPDKAWNRARQMLAAAKAVPAGWDAGQYAVAEGWDAQTAFSLIGPLNSLLADEIREGDTAGVALLQAAIGSLSEFGMGELADQKDALAQDAAEDAADGGAD